MSGWSVQTRSFTMKTAPRRLPHTRMMAMWFALAATANPRPQPERPAPRRTTVQTLSRSLRQRRAAAAQLGPRTSAQSRRQCPLHRQLLHRTGRGGAEAQRASACLEAPATARRHQRLIGGHRGGDGTATAPRTGAAPLAARAIRACTATRVGRGRDGMGGEGEGVTAVLAAAAGTLETMVPGPRIVGRRGGVSGTSG